MPDGSEEVSILETTLQRSGVFVFKSIDRVSDCLDSRESHRNNSCDKTEKIDF